MEDELERIADRVEGHRRQATSREELLHILVKEYKANEDEVFYRVALLAAMPLYSQLEN